MFADVLVQYKVKSLDQTYTYHVPKHLQDDVSVGVKVKIPFGNQSIFGFVIGLHKTSNVDSKDIIEVINKDIRLNDECIELGKYIKEKTLCTLISAYQTMLPTSLKVNNKKSDYSLKKTYVSLNKDQKIIDEYIDNNKRCKKQIEILNILKEGKMLKTSFNTSSLNILLNKELVKLEIEEVYRINNKEKLDVPKFLTKSQDTAYQEIKSSFNMATTHLLYGITGSGKTEIYMHLCDDIIKQNKRAIVLVPEISLTTQIVKRFYNRFQSNVAIFHSSLSDGEKFDEYKKILRNEVSIVVGTRSAIFVPINDLGLIIIDEEHSSSYKQENNPRYHAIEMAKWRSNYNKCPLVLSSATPSLESMARAKKGVYNLVTLDKRVGLSTLPNITLVSMADEYKKGNMILSDLLKEKIMNCLLRHEQVMLLLNRRGYSTIVTCESCGYTYKCPYCDITLTYHKSSNSLRCHYCGYNKTYNDICPNCHEKAINNFGLGTERVENYIKELYPSYRIVRMDKDTTTKKGSHDKIITSIENLEYDIIIGTQMISKGLDFPKLTLVGIINADESLNIPDFRSGENTFSLLSQVSGRAGRSNIKGEVIIQTFNPDNKTLNYVKNNDYLGNYNYEMNIRKTLKYPPYYYLTSIKVLSKEYTLASKEAIKIANYIKEHIDKSSICLGPTTSAMFKINNIYRFQIIIKYRFDNYLKDTLKYIDEMYIYNKDVYLEIDIDPIRI